MTHEKLIKLKGIVQNYDWGKDHTSIICSQFNYQSPSDKFAELWFGTHPKAPARIADSSQNLLDLTPRFPEILGNSAFQRFGSSLPFLFKVLSVNEALSIQAHPDTELAQELHKKDPLNYPDSFPKPEVGIAISTLKLLYGFKSLKLISSYLNVDDENFSPEFKNIIGINSNLTINEIYRRLVSVEKQLLKEESQKLYQRLKIKPDPQEEEQEILKLASKYPNGDIGIFCFYLLNLVRVESGEALFIDSNIPHAYLSGELLECMAPSDNVVRGGLTPKFIDLKTLMSMLDFKEHNPKLLKINPNNDLTFYETPQNNFFRIGKFAPTLKKLFTTENKVQLIFCLSGHASIQAEEETYHIPIGQAVLIPASINQFEITTQNSNLYIVRSPL